MQSESRVRRSPAANHPRPAARPRDEYALDRRISPQTVFHLRRGIRRAQAVNVRTGIDRKGDRKPCRRARRGSPASILPSRGKGSSRQASRSASHHASGACPPRRFPPAVENPLPIQPVGRYPTAAGRPPRAPPEAGSSGRGGSPPRNLSASGGCRGSRSHPPAPNVPAARSIRRTILDPFPQHTIRRNRTGWNGRPIRIRAGRGWKVPVPIESIPGRPLRRRRARQTQKRRRRSRRPIGKLFRLSTRAFKDDPALCPQPIEMSSDALERRPRLRDAVENKFIVFQLWIKRDGVTVSRPARFIDIDPLAGRRRPSSRLPQYLMKAMLGWAKAVAVDIIDKSLPCMKTRPIRSGNYIHNAKTQRREDARNPKHKLNGWWFSFAPLRLCAVALWFFAANVNDF